MDKSPARAKQPASPFQGFTQARMATQGLRPGLFYSRLVQIRFFENRQFGQQTISGCAGAADCRAKRPQYHGILDSNCGFDKTLLHGRLIWTAYFEYQEPGIETEITFLCFQLLNSSKLRFSGLIWTALLLLRPFGALTIRPEKCGLIYASWN